MTVSKQIADQIFKSSQLDDRINSSAKKLLLKKIEFVEAKEPYSLNLNKLKSKYVVLTSNQKREKTNGVKIVETKSQNDGIPRPKFVLFAAEQVELRWKKSLRAGAGLVNLGNTCFLNSALQCLTYTPPLANYLLSNQHRSQCRVNGGFCMLCSLQQHQGASFGNVGKSIRPMNILKNLRVIAKHLQFGRQEDAHEFIRYSVDAMQKSCLSGQPSKLDIHTKTTTLVYQIFGGYLRSRVKCRQCKAVSDTFDPFLDLSLDINKQDCNDLQRCLQHYVKPELLHGDNLYKCHRCKQAVPASKTFSIHRPPNVLTVQLKRFSSFMGNKINREVTYPSKLNLAPYMSSTQSTGPVYDLYAVLVHSGFSCNSGHYYAYAKASNGQWYCFNDSSVNQVSISHALNQQAYLLFYHRIPEHKHTKQPPKQPILGSMKHEVQMNGSRSAEVHRVGSGPITGRAKPHTTPGNKLLNGESPKWGLTNKFKPRVIGVGDSKKMKVDSIVPSSVGNPAVSSNAKDTLGKNLPNGGVNGHKVTTNEVQVSRELKLGAKIGAEKQIIKKSCEDVTNRLMDGDPMTPAEQNGPDWLETKLRERRNSAESNRRGNARISFKLKPFSSLPNHQKMWHKFHGKPRDSGCEDEHSTSSNDSRRSDKEKGNHARKLKILSEDVDHGRKRRWDEVEDHRAGGSSSSARHQDDEKKNGRTGILSKLLKMSSGKAYGGEVTSWDGGTSMVEEDARRDHVERSKSSTDGWDREFDRGKTKKIKKKKTHRSNTNLFQSFQKYKFATSTASF